MKRKSSRPRGEKEERNLSEESDTAKDDHSDAELETPSKKKKASKRKSAKRDVESDGEIEKEEHKRSSGRKSSKKTPKKADPDDFEEEEEPIDSDENGIDDAKSKKTPKKELDKKKKKSSHKVLDVQQENGASEDPQDGGKEHKKKQEDSEKDEESDEDQQYEVEEVLDEKIIKGVLHYLIRWKGYGSDDDTWESKTTLNCPDIIKKYKESIGERNVSLKKKSKSKKQKQKDATKEHEVDWSSSDEFEVDKIKEVHFKLNGKREFLVSWKGYPSSQDSWEPEDNLDCTDLINKFMDKVAAAKVSDLKDLRIKRKPTDRFTLAMDARGRKLSRRLGTKQRIHYHDAE